MQKLHFSVFSVLVVFVLLGCDLFVKKEKESDAISVLFNFSSIEIDKSVEMVVLENFQSSHPKVKLKLDFMSRKSYDNYLSALLASQRLPDIFMLQSEKIFQEYASNGRLKNMSSWFLPKMRADYLSIAWYEHAGYLYGVSPGANAGPFLLVNNSIFKDGDPLSSYIIPQTLSKDFDVYDFVSLLESLLVENYGLSWQQALQDESNRKKFIQFFMETLTLIKQANQYASYSLDQSEMNETLVRFFLGGIPIIMADTSIFAYMGIFTPYESLLKYKVSSLPLGYHHQVGLRSDAIYVVNSQVEKMSKLAHIQKFIQYNMSKEVAKLRAVALVPVSYKFELEEGTIERTVQDLVDNGTTIHQIFLKNEEIFADLLEMVYDHVYAKTSNETEIQRSIAAAVGRLAEMQD